MPYGFQGQYETYEEYIEHQRAAGRKGNEARRRKRAMREWAQLILNMGLDLRTEQDVEDALVQGGFSKGEATKAAGIIYVQVQKALTGDTKAAEFVRDTSGQKPDDKVQIGNLEDKPFETIDLSKLSDDELRSLLAAKQKKTEEPHEEQEEE